MVLPNKALVDCPDVSIDSPMVVFELLEKLSKKDKERKENVEQI